MSARPHIVLIPGAWLPPQTYTNYLNALTAEGYTTHLFTAPSQTYKDPTTVHIQADIDTIRDFIRPIIDNGNEVVLVMYSYGGCTGAAAAYGLSVATRAAEGKSGGILGLIFTAAFLIPEGQTLSGMSNGVIPDWVLLDNPTQGVSMPADPVYHFAADWPSTLTEPLATSLIPHPNSLSVDAHPPPAFADPNFEGRLAYQVTLQDRAIPELFQRTMIKNTGKEFLVKEIDGSHLAPFGGDLLEQSIQQVLEFVELFSRVE
ncbi:hypothetical protein HDV00_005470 [Rhizophlyctis rosea]|nr:hypothetical protein HDV00_005470 [Rhizophlyctis rosea]